MAIQRPYSRQFLAAAVENLDPRLVRFFKKKKHTYKFPYEDLADVLEDTLLYYFNGSEAKEDLAPCVTKVKNAKWKKKSRWYKSYLDDLTMIPYQDPSHPLSVQHLDKEMAQLRIDDEIERITRWKESANSLLIDFAGLSRLTNANIYKSFRVEVLLSAWVYIVMKLDGSISTFYRSFPAEFVESPLFSPTSFNLVMDTIGDRMLKETVYDENDSVLLELSLMGNEFNPPKVMDTTDLKILNTLMSSINNDFYKEHAVIIDLNRLALESIGYRPNSVTIDRIKQRCLKLVNYNYTVQTPGGPVAFNFLDSISIKDENEPHPYVIATFTEVLSNAIIQKKLINITNADYSALENPLSQIICYALQKERAALYGCGQESMVKVYTYTYFQKIVRFKQRNKQKNLMIIRDSLQDFKDHGICVKNFNLVFDRFEIEFIPLTKEEMEDLNFEAPLYIEG